MKQQPVYTIIILLAFFSCVKDKPVVAISPTVELSSAKKVYIVNEGNFGTGNASVSLYDPGNDQVIENIYESVNHAPVGDVAQSITYLNGRFYTVVNNSGKILVCDRLFKKTGQIAGLTSPRYMQQVSNQKAYISELSAGNIHIVDLNTNEKIGAIPCPGWTEGMVMLHNKVFVANPLKKYVYLINSLTDSLTDSVYVGVKAASLVLDKFDKLWVLAGGDKSKALLPRLSKINALTHVVDTFYEFKEEDSPRYLTLNGSKDTLYFLSEGIFRMAVTESSLPGLPFITVAGNNFYGLGVNPHNYTIYAADAHDYVQRSTVIIFDARGNRLSSFKAGINASSFYFE